MGGFEDHPGDNASVTPTEPLHLETFRRELRGWLKDNFPPELASRNSQVYITDGGAAKADKEFCVWLERVGKTGWGVPTWPVELGGAGLDEQHARVIDEEMARIGAFNPVRSYGQMMLAPTLMEFGTEAQKKRFIPPIARGEVRWCQGFSEPGAGSDLASLKTKCVDKGDHWLVTGQKVWTSNAHHSDWCFCLVRTDTTRKQGGISFLLIDMTSPGVEARPIALISGATHFCEVFFNEVKVPKENLVGEMNQGWTIAKRLLQYERDNLAAGRAEAEPLSTLARRYLELDETGAIANADLRVRLTRHTMRERVYAQTLQRVAEETTSAQAAGEGRVSIVSVLKNLGAGLSQSRSELIMEILGPRGLGWEDAPYTDSEIAHTRAWLHSRAYSIYGGTFEIQNNITAKRILGLPSA